MGTETTGAEAPILILTGNTLEAVDITDYLMRRGLDNVISATKIELCTAFLDDRTPPPRLVFFAFSLSDPAARDWLLTARAKGWRIILVNGESTEPELQDLPMLTRPFSTSHLDAVMILAGE
ncbi:hypothetical protein KUW17_02750 [Leisingera aquaemixtae]|uniref:hypothetical protein n=1 Tax=Leisingera aquaemixtae TaxID=1396826 RepID=UPI001C956A05|nr:hypothetical protein [Leisingera aquaemixtae]MBY6065643.1 hypothetical protein [Leisingera aquaemixtae]